MFIDLDQEDEESSQPELITDPIVKKYGHRLHLLTQELLAETAAYTLNPDQIRQLIDSLVTVRTLFVLAEDLERLDAMLRMCFPAEYYSSETNLVDMLTDYPLGSSN